VCISEVFFGYFVITTLYSSAFFSSLNDMAMLLPFFKKKEPKWSSKEIIVYIRLMV
jgi:hypothetical protein